MASEEGSGDLSILKQGWLTKKGHVRRNWKERWFVLQGTKLKYYEKPLQPGKERPLLGEIPLHKGSVAIDSSTQKDFMFTIQAAMVDGEKKNYLVKARTETDMREWIDAIGIAGKEGLSTVATTSSQKSRSATDGAQSATPSSSSASSGSSSSGPLVSGASQSSAFHSSSSSSSLAGNSTTTTTNNNNNTDEPSPYDEDQTVVEPEFFASLSSTSTSAAGADLYRLKFQYDGLLSHLNMLFETKLYNVHFIWSGISSLVGAHDYILQQRCPALYSLVAAQKKKRRPLTVVDLKSVQPPLLPSTLGHLLIYVYSDEISSINLQAADLVRLLQAAEVYELQRLALLCKQLLVSERFLNLEGTYMLLKEAHDLSVGWAKELALDFVHAHIKEFVKNKAESKKLGLDLFHEVVALTTDQYVPRQFPVDTPPEGSIKADFKQLYERTLSGDSGDTTVKLQMQTIRFHRALLSAHAKGFAEIFLNDKQALTDDVTAQLNLKNIAPESLRALLKFVYYGDENVATTHACDIQSFADRMFMHDFKNACDVAINSSLSHTNVMTVLGMTYLDQNKDSKQMLMLRAKAVDFLVDHIDTIDINQINSLPMSLDILKGWQKRVRADRSTSSSTSTSSSSSSAAAAVAAASSAPPLPSTLPPPGVPSRLPVLLPAEEQNATKSDEPPSRKPPPPPPLENLEGTPPVVRRAPPPQPGAFSEYKAPLPTPK